MRKRIQTVFAWIGCGAPVGAGNFVVECEQFFKPARRLEGLYLNPESGRRQLLFQELTDQRLRGHLRLRGVSDGQAVFVACLRQQRFCSVDIATSLKNVSAGIPGV